MSQLMDPPPFSPVEPVDRSSARSSRHRSVSLARKPEFTETRTWIEDQTRYARAYLDGIPGREDIRNRVRKHSDVGILRFVP